MTQTELVRSHFKKRQIKITSISSSLRFLNNLYFILFACLITARKQSCGKVMFSHVCRFIGWSAFQQCHGTGRPPSPQKADLLDTVNQWAVRILLEYILVWNKLFWQYIFTRNEWHLFLTFRHYKISYQRLLFFRRCNLQPWSVRGDKRYTGVPFRGRSTGRVQSGDATCHTNSTQTLLCEY